MNKIACYMAPGEGPRYQKLALTINEDPRFEPLDISSEIPVDIQFISPKKEEADTQAKELQKMYDTNIEIVIGGPHIFNVELKKCADYIKSALDREGHLYSQYLKMAEEQRPSMILVLGGDKEVSQAIFEALKKQYRGDELKYQVASYEDRILDFEAQCYGLHIPVMRWHSRPFKRLLSTAHKVLTGASLMQYCPRPVEGERDLVAASLLFRGIGAKTLMPVLDEYKLVLVPKKEYAKPIEDFAGVGKVRSAMIRERICMYYDAK